MNIAHVGADKPWSGGDGERVMTTIRWLLDLNADVTKPEVDIINLRKKRDFLRESKEYDVVVVHSVFHTDTANLYPKMYSELAWGTMSPLHTIENWRKRLVATGAKLIFIHETLTASLSGWQLGELPGYKMLHRDGKLTVYQKEQA